MGSALIDAAGTGDISVVLLTGTTGSGKTTVARATAERFPPTSAIMTVDLDELAWAFIPDGENERVWELRADNLAAIWPNVRSYGFRRVVISGAVATAEQLERIRDATAGADVVVVRLMTPPSLLRDRIIARDAGRLLQDHLAIMPVLEEVMDRAALEHHRVVNDRRTIDDVAVEVLQKVRWTEVLDRR